jgi:GNAT superfamily N-acetyltransferase
MIEHVGRLEREAYQEVEAGEADPFGLSDSEVEWMPKTHHTLLRRERDGALIGTVGLVFVDVEAGGGEAFTVAGVGGVMVTRAERGQGRLRPLLEAALERAAEHAERAMLFCAERNVGLYERFGFAVIEGPVTVQQSDGPRVMPVPAMWRPLRAGVTWPAGDVRLPGLPF